MNAAVASYLYTHSKEAVALLHIITFLIHAIAVAFASMMTAVLTHLAPVLLLAAAAVAAIVLLCTSFGIGGAAFVRRRRQRD